ncbi:MAG: hypothetical protein V4557_03585 [Bacteroidota bacterium]
MRSTRRSGGDNGYRTAEDFSNEGRGYERPSSYSDRYRYERDDTDYRGQGNDQNERNSSRQNNYYGNNNRIENTGRSREWTNHQSGWNDSGSNWGNRGMQDNNRYNNDGSYRGFGNRGSSGYGRGSDSGAPLSLNNNDDYRFGNSRYPQDDYGDWQNRNRSNDPYYNSQNDFLEDEEGVYGERMTNRNSYDQNANNEYRRSSIGNNYGNIWSRDNSNRQDNSFRRSRQGFGSMSKERRQGVTSQGGRASHENR